MQTLPRCATARLACALFIIAFLSGVTVFAAVAPQGDPVTSRATAHPDLFVATVHLPLDQLPSSLAATLRVSLSGISVNPDLAAFDLRAGSPAGSVRAMPNEEEK
jgi:hypothetical protein